jgi:hypothetical protein
MNQLEKETLEEIANKVWDCESKLNARKLLIREIKKLLCVKIE